MKVLPRISSEKIHQLGPISNSTVKTMQIIGRDKSEIINFSRPTSSALRKTESSSQKYLFSISKPGSIDNVSTRSFVSTEYSPSQVNYLPRIITRNEIKNKLIEFENKYDIDSKKFYSQWKEGKVVDSLDSLKWATLYELWEEDYLI